MKLKDRMVRRKRTSSVQLNRAIIFTKTLSFSCNALGDYSLEGTALVGQVRERNVGLERSAPGGIVRVWKSGINVEEGVFLFCG